MNKECNVSKMCGGCKLQGISYKNQLIKKQKYIESLLNGYHKVNKIIECENPYNYRNKVQVSFGKDEANNIIYGNYVESTHNIVEVQDCLICDERANEILKSIKKLIIKYKISIFDENSYKGCLRHVLVRTTNLNQIMVVLITGTTNINKKDLFIKDLIKYNPNIKTVVQNINNKHTSMVLGDRNIVLYGKGYVEDILCGLKFRISSSSFYQVNRYQTEKLYLEAIKAAKLSKDDVVIDAYCGTGTIGLVASKYCEEVQGVELNPRAIKDANINAKINKINNISFICEDAGKYMSYIASKNIQIDVVIMDPPRTGSDKKFMNSLLKLKPNRIVYISCNPETLKENLRYLNKVYRINTIQPVDMFPFTNHIETVVQLSLI